MANSIDYVSEKFFSGEYHLATSSDSIHERLEHAYMDEIVHAYPPGDSVPEHIRQRIEAVHTQLMRGEPIGDEGPIRAAIARLSAEAAEDLAKEIWTINDHLQDAARDE